MGWLTATPASRCNPIRCFASPASPKFGIYYQDWRQVPKPDNRPAGPRLADRGNLRIGTYGGHYLHVADTAAGPLDFLAIAAGQFGKWGALDHRAGMIDLEAGYQPQTLPRIKPWMRVSQNDLWYIGGGAFQPWTSAILAPGSG